MRLLRRHWGKLTTLLVLLLSPLVAHFAIGCSARLEPPALPPPNTERRARAPGIEAIGESYARRREGHWEVRLVGSPDQIGNAHTRLLYDAMVKNEGILLGRFEEQVPSWLGRTALLDLAQLRYRNVDQGMSAARLREIAAGARAFQPDPYADWFPTFQRFVYLNALYDMALSFEHSPLIGCTTFTISGYGDTLLARNFDFEVDSVFDEDKAVFFVREAGKLPFASVAWPGLASVVSGMNSEGVAVVVHGARAGEPRAEGEPVVHALRRVLQTAHDTDEAVQALREGSPMVSHIVIVTDAHGSAAAVERVPGRPAYLRRLPGKHAVTNHFVGPAASDPKNVGVEERTSTLPRLHRGTQLVERLRGRVTAKHAVALLRDRKGVNDAALELGDRRAIDALIATHGVVMDTTTRTLWVSQSPHVLGRFVAYDLGRMLSESYDPTRDTGPLPAIDPDPLLQSDAYRQRLESAP